MKLYIEHYTKIHKGKTMAFAVREGVLRDNHHIIVEDLKFLTRKGINIILFHNIVRNLGNNRFLFQNIESKLPSSVQIKNVPSGINIYKYILSVKQDVDKLIIIERQFLIGDDGKKINTISTGKLTIEIAENNTSGLGIGNINFKSSLLEICKAIENGNINRVHILPGNKKHAIKHELFSLEGVGTLIGNDFGKPKIESSVEGYYDIIKGILNSNKGNKYLKNRTNEYIINNINNFRVAYIDGIPVGCVEIIQENEYTIELGALAVVHSFLSLRIGISLIKDIENYAISKGFGIISLTNNEKLQGIYNRIGFKNDKSGNFKDRANKSPGVDLFYINHNELIANSIEEGL